MSDYRKYESALGGWKITREIGSDSLGKIFEIECEDVGYTRKAALKVITVPQSASEIRKAMNDGMDRESVTEYFRGLVQTLVDKLRIMTKLKGESNIVGCEDYRVVEHTDGIGWDIFIRMEHYETLRIRYPEG